MVKHASVALLYLLVTGIPALVHAQAYPNRPVRFIVPNAAGGGTDTFARIVGQKLAESWSQQVIIDNRAGAQGNIATALAAKSPADGYTMLLASVGPLTVNPFLYKDIGYDPIRDFTPVTLGSVQPYVMVVHPSVPVNSLKGLVALARSQPDKISFGAASAHSQVTGELFQVVTGTRMFFVPYKAATTYIVDVLAGNIDLAYASPAAAIPQVSARKLKGLAVTGQTRLPALPHVPTAVESGYPAFDVAGWYGVAVPAGTPAEVVTHLNAQINRALRAPEIREKLAGAGMESSGGSTVEEFTALIRREYDRWGRIIRARETR